MDVSFCWHAETILISHFGLRPARESLLSDIANRVYLVHKSLSFFHIKMVFPINYGLNNVGAERRSRSLSSRLSFATKSLTSLHTCLAYDLLCKKKKTTWRLRNLLKQMSIGDQGWQIMLYQSFYHPVCRRNRHKAQLYPILFYKIKKKFFF